MDWLVETWKLVQEDKANYLSDLAMVMPLARTPMDKRGATNLKQYADRVYKVIAKRTPWRSARGGKLRHLRDKVPSGEVRVLLGKGEADGTKNNPLFKDVKVIRE